MKILRPSLLMLLLVSVITGLGYPMMITGIAQVVFPQQANGSMVLQNGQNAGSTLIGQEFKKPGYFWARLSATGDHPYNGLASGGSNMNTGNPALSDAVKARIAELKKYPTPASAVPVDLVTASASGLDPHITPAAAYYQAPRVAGARHMDMAKVNELIAANTEQPWVGILGEPHVNVLALNMALDKL
jgi:K+-transporting ATPase ATPase C chain